MALTVFMWAIQDGAWEIALRHITDMFPGQVQIERAGFSDDYDVRKVISDTSEIFSRIRSDPDVIGFSPRLLATGMVRSPTGSSGALLVGIRPENESGVSKFSEYLKEGEFIGPGDKRGALIGDRMADDLGLRLGSKFVIMAMDSTGNISGEALRVKGIFHLGSAELDRGLVVLSSETLKRMLLVNGYHIIAIRVKSLSSADDVARRLNPGGGVVARSWREFLPVIEQTVQMKRGSVSIVLLLFMFLALSSIAATMLMSVQQRVREFGIMQAVGMKPLGVFGMVIAEGVILGAIGIVIGLIIGFIAVWITSMTGIDVSGFSEIYESYDMGNIGKLYPQMGAVFWSHFHEPILGFLAVSVLSSLYPAYIAARMVPSRAMRY